MPVIRFGKLCRPDHLELEKIQALLEQWADASPEQLEALASPLAESLENMEEQLHFNSRVSRFSFINALFSGLLNAA